MPLSEAYIREHAHTGLVLALYGPRRPPYLVSLQGFALHVEVPHLDGEVVPCH